MGQIDRREAEVSLLFVYMLRSVLRLPDILMVKEQEPVYFHIFVFDSITLCDRLSLIRKIHQGVGNRSGYFTFLQQNDVLSYE